MVSPRPFFWVWGPPPRMTNDAADMLSPLFECRSVFGRFLAVHGISGPILKPAPTKIAYTTGCPRLNQEPDRDGAEVIQVF